MIFNTPWFIAFFVIFYFLLWLIPGDKIRFFYVLAASAVFHTHFAGPAGVAPIIVMAVAVYRIALKMDASKGAVRDRWHRAGLVVPVLGLLYYKYRSFILLNLFKIIPSLAAPLASLAAQKPMPLAISFFTFEFVHYMVEVHKGGKPFRSPWRFALFCIYFPSIVSGPIKRYPHFDAQVEKGIPLPSRGGLAFEGLAQLLLGFFKKMVVADNAALMVIVLEKRDSWGPGAVTLLMLLLSVRILFDFSGYSDIAIGLSKMVGIRLPANFNFPYIAPNISDFWRRWHMSLSSWIRDYIYIPLGGSRKGPIRRGANALTAMALCGLWHGANWNFLVWGFYHGFGLTIHALFEKLIPTPDPRPLWSRAAAVAFNFAFVSYGWLYFFYPMGQALRLSKALLGLG